MKLIELFLESLGTLTLNKTRTALAVLGIIIGIGSVIALMSLGQATQKSIQNQIQRSHLNCFLENLIHFWQVRKII